VRLRYKGAMIRVFFIAGYTCIRRLRPAVLSAIELLRQE